MSTKEEYLDGYFKKKNDEILKYIIYVCARIIKQIHNINPIPPLPPQPPTPSLLK